MENMVKCVGTCCIGMALCIRGAILMWCLRDIFIRDYFGENLHQSWTRRSKRSFGGGVDIGKRAGVVTANPFLQVRARIYKRTFTYQSTVLVEMA